MGLIAVDTNVLVYAAHGNSPNHRVAAGLLQRLAVAAEPWAIPWPCVYEFLKIMTHARSLERPWTPEVAVEEAEKLLGAPGAQALGETSRHAAVMSAVIRQSQCRSNQMHDAHIWALCLEHGVSELWSADRDFHRFRGLKLHNPFSTAP